jgi:diguanylate cyclase (GGDEF)-like protein/PAS domain S-box-containing protein
MGTVAEAGCGGASMSNDGAREGIGPDDYRAVYENSPNGVLFSAPDGRVIAANPAASTILRMTEHEICSLGRQGLADHSDERWGQLLAERQRAGTVQGVARMVRGDGVRIEVDISAKLFITAYGETRSCTVIRDVTERVEMERRLAETTAQLRELALRDELTGLRNRRGLVEVSSQVLELADRQQMPVHLLFVDVDKMKDLNDSLGHNAGDAALTAVAQALCHALRGTDVVSRIGGDEFAVLTLGFDDTGLEVIEHRIRGYLGAAPTVANVGAEVQVSMGWAHRSPGQPVSVDDLLKDADRVMYRAKAVKSQLPVPRMASGPDPARRGGPDEYVLTSLLPSVDSHRLSSGGWSTSNGNPRPIK